MRVRDELILWARDRTLNILNIDASFSFADAPFKGWLTGQQATVLIVDKMDYQVLCVLSMCDLVITLDTEISEVITSLYGCRLKVLMLRSDNLNTIKRELFQLEARYQPPHIEQFQVAAPRVSYVGKPLDKRFLVSILHHDNLDKLNRCLDKLSEQTYLSDVAVIIVDDATRSQGVQDAIIALIERYRLEAIVVSNTHRMYAAYNLYQVIHRWSSSAHQYLIELDSDDYFMQPWALEYLAKQMLSGSYKKGMGGFRVHANGQDVSHLKFFRDAMCHVDMTLPRNMSRFSAWLPTRITRLDVLRQVELVHYLEVGQQRFLRKNHDTAIHTRVMELIEPHEVVKFDQPTYCYDISGAEHDDKMLSFLDQLDTVEYGRYVLEDDYIRLTWSPLLEESHLHYNDKGWYEYEG